jgi:hypothetical protein
VGGKAANLSRLARLYHRVPDGFSVPVTVMEAARPLDLPEEVITAVSDLVRCHSLTSLAAAVRSPDSTRPISTSSGLTLDESACLELQLVLNETVRQ